MSGYNPIVQVNVSVAAAPTPSTLQRTGAFVSQGGTTLAVGTYGLLTAASSLTSILNGSHSVSGIVIVSTTATVTTAAPHGFTISDTILITIAGGTPSGVNGTFLCTITGASTFTYTTAASGSVTGTIVYTVEDVAELVAMNTTFFAQGPAVSVYVLELGAGNAADGVTALAAWITANPGVVYSWLLPHTWGVYSSFYTSFAINYTSDTAKTYFHVTTTAAFQAANPTLFAATLKCLIVGVEAPAVAAAYAAGTPTEFSRAAFFYVTLNLNPNAGIPVTQAAFSFEFGVTPYPTIGNQSLFAGWKTANINYVGTGSEGGLASNAIEFYGNTLDGNDFNKFWYSIDNVQINLDLNTANAVINGSNNTEAPLNYNPQGINTLQSVAGNTMQTEISLGLALGQLKLTQLTAVQFAANVANGLYLGMVVVNAVPFQSFVTLVPSDYQAGIYSGLSVVYAPQLGFRQIIYNVLATTFA
jgi:hypothetical protein